MEKIIKTLACAILATAVTISQSMAREGDQISIVGSSTVFPFSTIVAERFAKNTDFKAPRHGTTKMFGNWPRVSRCNKC